MPLTKPLARAHLDQARSNHQLHSQLRREAEHLDWALTLLFYTALQLVQAYCVETARSGFDIPRGHDQRREAVQKRLPALADAYHALEDASLIARYKQDKPDPTDAQIQSHYENNFLPILKRIEQRLGFPIEL